MRKSPSQEFITAFPDCPTNAVKETNRAVIAFTGWLDVVKFDEWLAKAHGFDPDAGESTLDFVTKKFGAHAAEVLRNEV
jgi:hypothetical protein